MVFQKADLKNIQDILLANYFSDLKYSQVFHVCFLNRDFQDGRFSLASFLKEYFVFKRIIKGKFERLCKLLLSKEINYFSPDKVQEFAIEAHKKQITHGVEISMCSKIFFLANLSQVCIYDKFAKIAVGSPSSNYVKFYEKSKDYRVENEKVIKALQNTLIDKLVKLEQFAEISDLKNIQEVRKNRIADKMMMYEAGYFLRIKKAN